MELRVHPTACVHEGARLGPGTEVGPFAVIEEDVVIGERCHIGAHAVIKTFTRMGDDNEVYEGSVLGGVPQDYKFHGERSELHIGDRNVFRESVTVHRGTEAGGGVTRIGSDSLFMVNAHVAHDCRLEDHIVMANNVALAGCLHIEEHVFISGGVVIHQFCQVGRYAMIGGNAKITQDVLPFFLTDGAPGRVRGLNLVGLRRAGFDARRIGYLKSAYRVLLQQPGPLPERLQRLAEVESDDVRHLVEFIRRSKRGFSPASRGRSARDDM